METPSSESLGLLHVGRRSKTYRPFKEKPLIFINESGVFGFNKGLSNITTSQTFPAKLGKTPRMFYLGVHDTPLFFFLFSFFINLI